jgi:hypothetical protein
MLSSSQDKNVGFGAPFQYASFSKLKLLADAS